MWLLFHFSSILFLGVDGAQHCFGWNIRYEKERFWLKNHRVIAELDYPCILVTACGSEPRKRRTFCKMRLRFHFSFILSLGVDGAQHCFRWNIRQEKERFWLTNHRVIVELDRTICRFPAENLVVSRWVPATGYQRELAGGASHYSGTVACGMIGLARCPPAVWLDTDREV